MNSNTYRTAGKVYSSTSLEKGHAFEDYIVNLFNEQNFQLLNWRSDKIATNGVIPQSNSFPDLEYVFMGNKRHRFAVECKWRKRFIGGKIEWATHYQIQTYEKYEKENRIPVFIAIGVGGECSNPAKLFVTPLCNISKYTEVFESQLILYKRKPTQKFFYDTKQLRLF